MRQHRAQESAFTLIEIMLVTGMMLLMLGWGIPNMMRALEKHGISKATMDIMDGCKQARALAILKSQTSELVIASYEDGYALYVTATQTPHLMQQDTGILPKDFDDPDNLDDEGNQKSNRSVLAELDGFRRNIGGDIAIEMLDINFINMLEGTINEAKVRFYPNGTSDEFTIGLLLNDDRRIVTLDAITGLPSVMDPSKIDL